MNAITTIRDTSQYLGWIATWKSGSAALLFYKKSSMYERAQDAFTYDPHYGSSVLFMIFTCYPKWKEIQEVLLTGQKHYHRPDIIARVSNHKVKKIMNLLIRGEFFEKLDATYFKLIGRNETYHICTYYCG